MSQKSRDISIMNLKELSEYLNLPIEVVRLLKCNWYEETTGYSCIALDGFFEWRPLRVTILNALPLNAFQLPVDLKIYPTDASKLLGFLASMPLHDYSCYIGHPQTAAIISKYLPIKCERGVYTYNTNNNEILIAFTLKSRPNISGADVNVNIDDLNAYIILPSPLS
jgi:hypothetical protein